MVIVQGDEGPVRGVAQSVDCHGVTVGHQEREEEEIEQEVEGEKEEEHSNNNAHVLGWDDYGRQVRAALSHVECDVNTSDDATTDRMQVCSSLHFVRVYVRRVIHVIVHCPQWSHRCWKCACRRTHFFVAICHSHLFVNFCIRRYCIYTSRR